jgi:hypothetical protein
MRLKLQILLLSGVNLVFMRNTVPFPQGATKAAALSPDHFKVVYIMSRISAKRERDDSYRDLV